MNVETSFRPRLGDVLPIERNASAAMAAEASEAAEAARGPRVTPRAALEDRVGYADDFLDERFVVEFPRAKTASKRADVLSIPGADNRLAYMHFSVMMSSSRRMAMVVGVNIDGTTSRQIPGDSGGWSLDGRIDLDAQIGEALYADNALDRGHLVRREDPNWGDDAEQANEDTFHFTNCAPQMNVFNQQTWLGLENYLLLNTRRWRERVTVFTGPVFGPNDLEYRGVEIPLAYWKVVAFIDDSGRPSSSAYMIDQSRELTRLEAAFGAYKTYQRSVRRIEEISGLTFGPLLQFDALSNEEAERGLRVEIPLTTLGDIHLPTSAIKR